MWPSSRWVAYTRAECPPCATDLECMGVEKAVNCFHHATGSLQSDARTVTSYNHLPHCTCFRGDIH